MATSQADDGMVDAAPPQAHADEAALRELAQVGDWLARLVLLNGGLTGGGVFLLTDYALGPRLVFRVAVVLLLGATVCAAQGLASGIGSRQLGEQARLLLRKKTWWLQRSLTALLGGLGLAVAGILLR